MSSKSPEDARTWARIRYAFLLASNPQPYIRQIVTTVPNNNYTVISNSDDIHDKISDVHRLATVVSIALENDAVNRSYRSDDSPNIVPMPTVHQSTQSLTKGYDPRALIKNYNDRTLPQINGLSQNSLLSMAYEKKWVGFKDMDGRSCPRVLLSNATNGMFRSNVKRVRGIPYTGSIKQCRKFREFHGFKRYPEASDEEKNFPIAFIILFHNNIDQIMFLLRAIYRPHNVYCLTVDEKNDQAFISYVKNVFQCLPNVFVASQLERIVYAGFSRLMADIHCMRDLLKHPVQWKYVINMPGSQFPLRTNLELVRILTIQKGSNDIEGVPRPASVPNRYQLKHDSVRDPASGFIKVMAVSPRQKNDPPPHNMTIVKGSTYGTFSRAFVHFALHHPIAKEFLEYSRYFKSPDEYFWATLQHTNLVQVPGGFTGEPGSTRYFTSYSLWDRNGTTTTCYGKFVHKICVFSPEDLPNLIKQNFLFANKFFIYSHPAALHCMDEWLYNRTVAGIVGDLSNYTNQYLNNTDKLR
ncbi:hypothetical protein BsWGS_18197 [Bradybaena similaris]